MVENYQQEQTLKEPETPNYTFATIGQIYDDGMSLIFPGAEGPSEKHYKANLYCKFKAGQRVYIAKDSGTYVVLFPVGVSGSESVVSDSAKTAETATKASTANSATTANTANKANTAENADSATKSTTADKWTNARTISLSGAISGSASIDGSQNVTINTSASNLNAETAKKLATARTISLTGDVTGSANFDGSQNISISTDFKGSVSNADTADRWTTSRTLKLSGDASGSVSMNGSSNVTLSVDVKNFDSKHTGSTLGFFNTSSLSSKRTIATLTSTPTVDNLKTKLNDLINALKYYNLI